MVQSKWVKLGAAAFLSVGMLSACGDAENEQPADEDTEVTPGEEEEENEDDEDEEEED